MAGITSDKDLKQLASKAGIKVNKINYKDKLGNHPKDGNYIINMASSGDQGTHWTGLLINGSVSYYFDSFAFPPPMGIRNFIRSPILAAPLVRAKVKKLYWNDKQIQKMNSNYCGSYVIYFLQYMNQKKGSLNDRFENFINEWK